MNDLLICAEDDYKLVMKLWNEIEDEWALRGVVYHLQQAIEKLLKALIMISGKSFPYTHDIGALIPLCSSKFTLPKELDEVADSLTLWESKFRYNANVYANTQIVIKCKQVYQELHKIVLDAMFAAETHYGLNDFLRDPTVLMKVMEKHPKDYAEWFEEKFPDGASSAEEVLSKL